MRKGSCKASPMAAEWNPRYVAYARTQKRTPEVMLVKDRERYPGGSMCGFMLWLRERWAVWLDQKGYHHDTILSNEDHTEFDAWLANP
jgi:hypothetical protein